MSLEIKCQHGISNKEPCDGCARIYAAAVNIQDQARWAERFARDLLGLEGAAAEEVAAAADVGIQDQARTRLLARMAGNIAAGLVSSRDTAFTLASKDVADRAVEIAEAILARLENKA